MSGPDYHGWTHRATGTDPIGYGKWARHRLSGGGDFPIPSGTSTGIEFNVFNTDASEYFEATTLGIKVKQPGLYSILARIYWKDWPGQHILTINGIDPDEFAGYSAYAVDLDDTFGLSNGLEARLAADDDVFPTVYHEAGGDKSLADLGGNFIEVRWMGDATLDDRDGSI